MTARLVEVVRNGVVESVHAGTLVALDRDGREVLRVGDPDRPVLPRSSAKPLQTAGLLESGLGEVLGADDELVAVACASHNGEPGHVTLVRRLLSTRDLDESALGNTAALPWEERAAAEVLRVGGRPAPVTQNCSGKHAAMLVTAAQRGWPLAGYLDPAHPVQQAVRGGVEGLTGQPTGAVAVDGCGAPLLATTLRGLARAFGRLALAPAGSTAGRVARAMRRHPWVLGGEGRDVTALVTAVPGLVAKDGAEGVYAAALPDGTAVALKVADGAARAATVALLEALRALGAPADALAAVPVSRVLGGGRVVGEVRAVPLA